MIDFLKKLREKKEKELLNAGTIKKPLRFFPANPDMVVTPTVTLSDGEHFETLDTTSAIEKRKYRVYGILKFMLDGKYCQLTAYTPGPGRLFIPFKDLAEDIYKGGRYLDINNSSGEEIRLNFNNAYNPYCSYDSHDLLGWSCPIVPECNYLPVAITAGEKAYDPS